jgi:transposase
LLHGYANPLKKLDTSESVNPHKYLILLDSCRIHATRWREFANGKTLGSYAGLTPTPFSSGATEREQGIGKTGNRRLRTVMVELAWLWQRYQPGSAQVSWFRERVSGRGRRMRKVMVVAMARRLLIALWRFATQGVVPAGAIVNPAS